MNFKKQIIAGAFSLMAMGAVAEESGIGNDINTSNIYVGGGLGMNSLSGFDDAMGFQVFGGYRFDDNLIKVDKVKLAVEAGYMTSGDFDFRFGGSVSADGIWAATVADYAVNEQVSGLLRLGLDFGDDDGLLMGFGGEYRVDHNIAVRGEYVIRDNVNSLQVNIVYGL